MMHFTAFGSTEAEISPAGFIAFTIFGGAELRRPTLAQRIMQRRAVQAEPNKWEKWLGRDQSLVVTIFGGSEIIAPTLMEEFVALRNLVQSGVLSREECLNLVDDLQRSEQSGDAISRLTLFGGCTLEAPTAEVEHKALQSAENARVITPEKRQELAQLVGNPSGAMLAQVAFA